MMTYENQEFSRPVNRLVAGMLSGLTAGMLMALLAMLHAGMTGAGVWNPLLQIARVWLGPDSLLGGPGAVLVGLLTHLVVAAVLGMIFSIFWGRLRTPIIILSGVGYGVVIWTFMTYFVLPVTSEGLHRYARELAPFWFVMHLVFGLVLGILVGFIRRETTTP